MAQQPTDQSGGALDIQGPQMMSGEELRATREPGQLVGGDVQGVGNMRDQTDGAGPAAQPATSRFGGRGGANQFNQFNQMFNTGMMNSMLNQRQQLRMPMTLGFTPRSMPSAADVGNRVQTRLTKIPQLRKFGRMTVEMDGRVAVLRGAVTSEDERDLVARVVLLEPGISDVRNELQVATAEAVP